MSGVNYPSLWVVGVFFGHRCSFVFCHVDRRVKEVMLAEVFQSGFSFCSTVLLHFELVLASVVFLGCRNG